MLHFAYAYGFKHFGVCSYFAANRKLSPLAGFAVFFG
ncbi:MAG: hypothetical protein SLRJCFUN_002036 [Candidatus Fervidibacter sp.]|jgi:hypothetical protein